ncbi:MAG: glycosyltransferase family A protein [Terricaulis sp.]
MACVDVVIPCYNYARYLERAVESALNQRDVEVRVLIIDDKSTDDTPAVGMALAAKDKRVTFRRHEVNQGHIKTFNEGILGWVSADYYTLVSADDALTQGSLARAAAVLDAHPDVSLVYGKALLLTDHSEAEIPADAVKARYQIMSGKRFLQRNCESGNPAPSPAVVLRTITQQRLGGYNARMVHTSDMEMWMRFASRGPIAVIQDAQAYYRLHDSNMSDFFNNQALRDRQEIIDTCEEAIGTWCKHIPEAQQWLTDLKRRFADEAYWLAGQAFEASEKAPLAARLAFARRHHPSPWSSKPAWSYRMKAIIGRPLWNALRDLKAKRRKETEAAPDAQSYRAQRGEIGWWPEAA